LLAELQEIFAPLAGKPITVRLLDLGGDKPLQFLNFPVEDDPFLGLRGVRLLLRYPDLLDTQFNALLEFSRGYDVRILVPMVTLAEDMALIPYCAQNRNWNASGRRIQELRREEKGNS